MKIEDIPVPIDFSPGSLQALDYALAMVDPGGEVYILHVIDADRWKPARSPRSTPRTGKIGCRLARGEPCAFSVAVRHFQFRKDFGWLHWRSRIISIW